MSWHCLYDTAGITNSHWLDRFPLFFCFLRHMGFNSGTMCWVLSCRPWSSFWVHIKSLHVIMTTGDTSDQVYCVCCISVSWSVVFLFNINGLSNKQCCTKTTVFTVHRANSLNTASLLQQRREFDNDSDFATGLWYVWVLYETVRAPSSCRNPIVLSR